MTTMETNMEMSTMDMGNVTTPANMTGSAGSGGLSQTTIIYIVTTIVVGFGMIGIGCTVHYRTLWYYLKRPKAFLTGVLLQLLLVPLIGWAMAKMFRMPQAQALGVMIQGSCPGGTTSNIVVYWMDGIVDLSVVMTATSTLLALGTLPLWLFIFQSAENITSFVIPFQEIGITLACLVVPLCFGVILNWKFPKKAALISRVLIISASLAILVILVVTSILNRRAFIVTWKQVVVACIMPLVTFIVGYLAVLVPCLKLGGKARRTVSLEIALQNVQVAAAVIQLTFTQNPFLQLQILLFPLLYYIFQVSYAAFFTLLFIVGKKKGWIKPDEDEVNVPELDDRVKKGTDNPNYTNDAGATKKEIPL